MYKRQELNVLRCIVKHQHHRHTTMIHFSTLTFFVLLSLVRIRKPITVCLKIIQSCYSTRFEGGPFSTQKKVLLNTDPLWKSAYVVRSHLGDFNVNAKWSPRTYNEGPHLQTLCYTVSPSGVRTITAPLSKLLQKNQAHSRYILDSGSNLGRIGCEPNYFRQVISKFCEYYWLFFSLQNIWYLSECNCTSFSLSYVKT